MKSTKRRRGNGPGKGKVWISTSIPESTDLELRKLATASRITRSAMAAECIQDAVARGLTVTKHRSHAGKVIDYPGTVANPTARVAEDSRA